MVALNSMQRQHEPQLIFKGSSRINRKVYDLYNQDLVKICSKIFSIFLKTFRTFRSFENFSRNRSRRDDSFGPKIAEFRAILAIFRPFEDRNQTE